MNRKLIQRRSFITLLGGAAAAWPLAARAQQAAMPVIGFLNSGSSDRFANLVAAFRRGLSEQGFVEGQNVAIDYRWAQDQNDRLRELAADLVHRQVAVIVATSNATAALAAKEATTTIPIIFQLGVDPIEVGLVTSLNRPSGNLTGVTSLNVELGPKRLELINELLPKTTVALLVNPANRNADILSRDALVAARTLGLQLHVVRASSELDLENVFTTLAQVGARALVIGPDSLFNGNLLASLALRRSMPAIYQSREFAQAGGLMSYGGSLTDQYHQVGIYAGLILKGEKPADLPVHQITRVELIINMKTAKAFGLTFPLTLLGRADEVIE